MTYEKTKTAGEVKFVDQFLTLKNYKEPLMEIPRREGYGWYGTIAATLDGTGIQCHVCGRVLQSLPGHIQYAHKITIREYRNKYKLSTTSALVSENERFRLKRGFLDFIKAMTPEEKEAWILKKKTQLSEARKKNPSRNQSHPLTLEEKNKRGTCPDQLLDKIKEVEKAIGHTPSKREFINHFDSQRFMHLLIKTYGSWNKALTALGLAPKSKFLFVKGQKPRRYSDEEILESLLVYAQENGKVPTDSDFRRGFIIANSETCKRRFGSFDKARQLAGVYDFVDEENLRIFKRRSNTR